MSDLKHEIEQRDLVYRYLNNAETLDNITTEDRVYEVVEAIRTLMMLLENKGIITDKLTDEEY